MQFHEEASAGNNRVGGYGSGYFIVNDARRESSLLLSRSDACLDWSARAMADIDLDALDTVLGWKPDIILLGTGDTHQFAPPDLVARAAAQRAALEAMNTGAACRTFNVLAGEGRNVAALLLVM